MKATWSATRNACCRLWVTITTPTLSRRPTISSSIVAVEIGSSAEQGSSSSSTSGFGGERARDAQALLLAPGEAQRRTVQVAGDLVVEARPRSASSLASISSGVRRRRRPRAGRCSARA